jgi:hypothetical protein
VREIVIVVADLYLEPGLPGRPAMRIAGELASQAAPVPGESPGVGIEHLTRFGSSHPLKDGWRAWVARWLGLPQHASAAPASVAAAELAGLPAERAVWLATPLHLIAGLASVHFDRRSLLRLPPAELEALAVDFGETFGGSGLELHPLASGELLLSGAAGSVASITTEPARLLLMPMADALPAGDGAPALRRLTAEIEMWLHGHPLNEERPRRGVPPVSTLWIWGGGAPAPAIATQQIAAAAFAADAYVRGLWRLAGGESAAMPVDWQTVIDEARVERVLGVVEVAELLHAHPAWRLADALAEIDRRWLSPSLGALHRGVLDRLVLVANDRCLTLRALNRWRLWRRRRPGLEGLA